MVPPSVQGDLRPTLRVSNFWIKNDWKTERRKRIHNPGGARAYKKDGEASLILDAIPSHTTDPVEQYNPHPDPPTLPAQGTGPHEGEGGRGAR